MTNQSIGMGEQDRSERDKFENELKRILEASDKAGILLRVMVHWLFKFTAQIRIPASRHGRLPTSISAPQKQTKQVQR
jgi:hypothetical protein